MQSKNLGSNNMGPHRRLSLVGLRNAANAVASSALVTMGAHAQVAPASDAAGGTSPPGLSAQDLAKKLSNPVAALISVPFQRNYDRGIGSADEGVRWLLNIQPVVPVTLNAQWNLISRTIVPVVQQDEMQPGSGSQFGLGDIVQSLFVSPKEPTAGGLIWGAGPVFLLPTGTDLGPPLVRDRLFKAEMGTTRHRAWLAEHTGRGCNCPVWWIRTPARPCTSRPRYWPTCTPHTPGEQRVRASRGPGRRSWQRNLPKQHRAPSCPRSRPGAFRGSRRELIVSVADLSICYRALAVLPVAIRRSAMQASKPSAEPAAARVLALLVSANGKIDNAELARLEDLRAFERLGIAQQDFVELARRCLVDIGAGLCERSWLRISDMHYVDALLDAVPDPAMRLLVCRLCAAAISADGKVSADERLLYGHMLARWRIHPDAVTQDFHSDPVN